ncbi:hypothetical protein EON66_02310 [archaeon]|nr:MAG: hypothetical protein EON66_02310 [archaeon]
MDVVKLPDDAWIWPTNRIISSLDEPCAAIVACAVHGVCSADCAAGCKECTRAACCRAAITFFDLSVQIFS